MALCWDNGNLTPWKIRSANTQMDKTCRETTRSQAEFLSTISSEVKKKAKEVGNILDLAPRFAAPAPKTAETGEPVKNLHGVLVM